MGIVYKLLPKESVLHSYLHFGFGFGFGFGFDGKFQWEISMGDRAVEYYLQRYEEDRPITSMMERVYFGSSVYIVISSSHLWGIA